MKVFILTKNDTIVAISESKKDITTFALQNNLYTKDYSLHKTTNPLTCDSILSIYSDYYVYEIDNGVFARENEIPMINEDLYYIRQRMQDAVELLDDIDRYVDIPKLNKREKYRKMANTLYDDLDNINVRNIVKDIYKRIDLNPELFLEYTMQ